MSDARTLSELIERDNVTATWFWTHSVSVDPYKEMESYDVVFTRDGRPSVTGELERPALFVRGIRQSVANSMRNNGGRKIEPDPHETLGSLLSHAIDVDNISNFEEWGAETWGDAPVPMVRPGIMECDPHKIAKHAFAEASRARKVYEEHLSLFADMRRWLGDAYDEYTSVDLGA